MVYWKVAAFRLENGMIIIEEGKSKSTQHVEVITALLLAKQSHKDEKQLTPFYRLLLCGQWNSNLVRKMEKSMEKTYGLKKLGWR